MEVRDKIRDKFGISSEQIIEQIQRNPAVTLDEIAAALSVTRRSIEKKIKELREIYPLDDRDLDTPDSGS